MNLDSLGNDSTSLQYSQILLVAFLLAVLVKTIWQFYLSKRNSKWVEKNSDRVPAPFQDRITLADHQKAAQYTIAKGKAGRFFLFIETAILLFWTVLGGINWLDELIRLVLNSTSSTSTLGSPIWRGVFFITFFSLINLVLDLPENIYETFFLEEKFGFNRTTIKTFILDHVKQLLLGAIIGLPLFCGVIWIMNYLGAWWWAYAWGLLTAVQLLLMWVYPVLLAPIFNKFTPLPEGEVKEMVTKLLQENKFSYKGLYLMDASKRSSHGNAYFTGFGRFRRIVFFDTLIQTLTPEEIVAVLAHEVGHYRHHHVLKHLAFAIVSSGVGFWILGQLTTAPWFYNAFKISEPSSYLALILFSLVGPSFTFFFTPLAAWLSRRHEYAADKFAAQVARAQDLISALVKMYKDNASTLTPDPLFVSFYYSHPDAASRVAHLSKLSENEH